MKTIHKKPTSFFQKIATTNCSQFAEVVLSPGQSTGGSENKHPTSDQLLYVVPGGGKATVEGKTIELHAGSLLIIEAGETHQIKNDRTIPLSAFDIYSPPAY